VLIIFGHLFPENDAAGDSDASTFSVLNVGWVQRASIQLRDALEQGVPLLGDNMRLKIFLILMLVSMTQAQVYPTFNGSREPWTSPMDIVLDAPVAVGLTNEGVFDLYDFRFEGSTSWSWVGSLLPAPMIVGPGSYDVYKNNDYQRSFVVVPEPSCLVWSLL